MHERTVDLKLFSSEFHEIIQIVHCKHIPVQSQQ